MKKARRYYQTLKYLKPSQLMWQVYYRLHKSQPKVQSAIIEPAEAGSWCPPLIKIKSVSNGKATFLNEMRDVSDRSIWNDNQIPTLWLYNLHYFDVLSSDISAKEAINLIERWIDENPQAKGFGWDPYPISLRVVNWIKWLLSGNKPTEKMLVSLYNQARVLRKRIENHILGNHLFENLKALLFCGLFFSGKEADGWYHYGFRRLNKQIKEQILEDGGHFELSPMYHAIILEGMLDIANVMKAFSCPMSKMWEEKIYKMMQWLEVMTHPDGDIALFNDAAMKLASTPSSLYDYAGLLGFNFEKSACIEPRCVESQKLTNTGYARLENSRAVLIVDIGEIGPSYQPGHAHADSLTFELSLRGQRVIVNSGTSLYAAGVLRNFQRSTQAHNTIVINDRNSSNVWGGFRVGQRAHIINSIMEKTDDGASLSASHDGYLKKEGCVHKRTWALEDDKLVIEDEITGNEMKKIDCLFHFHPDIFLEPHQKEFILKNKADQVLGRIEFDSLLSISTVESQFYPEFGLSSKNVKIIGTLKSRMPIKLNTVIYFN